MLGLSELAMDRGNGLREAGPRERVELRLGIMITEYGEAVDSCIGGRGASTNGDNGENGWKGQMAKKVIGHHDKGNRG